MTDRLFRLAPIERDGSVIGRIVARELEEACRMGAQHFASVGYLPPWIGYVAFDGDECMETCAFKTPPINGVVEIAYGTLERHQNKGYATAMVRALIDIARRADSKVTITAQTLPGSNASARVLTKAGFVCTGELVHPEDGLVAEWRLA